MHPKTPSSIDVHVGTQIRLHRKMIGLSQGALAEKLGITFQQVQKYEKGTNRVGASRIQGIASILGVNVNSLFPSGVLVNDQGTHPGHEASGLKAFLASNEGFALNQAFSRIQDVSIRRRVVALVSAVANAQDAQSDENTDV